MTLVIKQINFVYVAYFLKDVRSKLWRDRTVGRRSPTTGICIKQQTTEIEAKKNYSKHMNPYWGIGKLSPSST